MANAYDVMRMAKQMGAQSRAEEDWINYLDKFEKWESQVGMADIGSQLWSVFSPDFDGGGGTGTNEKWGAPSKKVSTIIDLFSGGGIPGFAIKQIGGTILKNLLMGGKKKPEFKSSDPSNPYSAVASRPYEMKGQIKSDEAERILSQMGQESILTNLLLSDILPTGDIDVFKMFGIGRGGNR